MRLGHLTVGGDVAERLAGTGRGPATPHLAAPARVTGVPALPVRRVRTDRRQQRQPWPDAVDHADALVLVLDPHVHVHPAHVGVSRDLTELVLEAQVARLPRELLLLRRERRRCHRDGPRPRRGGRLPHRPTAATQGLPELAGVTQRVGGGLHLVPEQLEPDLLAGVVGGLGAVGAGSGASGLRVDEDELLLDADGPRELLGHGTLRSARAPGTRPTPRATRRRSRRAWPPRGRRPASPGSCWCPRARP